MPGSITSLNRHSKGKKVCWLRETHVSIPRCCCRGNLKVPSFTARPCTRIRQGCCIFSAWVQSTEAGPGRAGPGRAGLVRVKWRIASEAKKEVKQQKNVDCLFANQTGGPCRVGANGWRARISDTLGCSLKGLASKKELQDHKKNLLPKREKKICPRLVHSDVLNFLVNLL